MTFCVKGRSSKTVLVKPMTYKRVPGLAQCSALLQYGKNWFTQWQDNVTLFEILDPHADSLISHHYTIFTCVHCHKSVGTCPDITLDVATSKVISGQVNQTTKQNRRLGKDFTTWLQEINHGDLVAIPWTAKGLDHYVVAVLLHAVKWALMHWAVYLRMILIRMHPQL